MTYIEKALKRSVTVAFLTVIVSLITGCHADTITAEEIIYDYSDIESAMALNVNSLQELAVQAQKDGKIERIESESDSVWRVYFENLASPVILSKEGYYEIPRISVEPVGNEFYWYLGDDFLYDAKGGKIKVGDKSKKPKFSFDNGEWLCTTDHSQIVANSQRSYTNYHINVTDDKIATVSMPSAYAISFPTSDFVLPSVPQQAFYKDIFLDAGIGLTSRKFLYAANLLKLSLEGVSFPRSGAKADDIDLQNRIIAGEKSDTNGRLLYPDGQPRYRLLFVNGGSATDHGVSLNEKALNNMRIFVRNGGSYVGTCAGAFFASSGHDAMKDHPYYLHLWPSTLNRTGLSEVSTGMFIEDDSPLLQYYDFGGDHYVDNIRHNGGGYPANLPANTEILARYDYPSKDDVHLQPSIWAYKSDKTMGRIVMEGSHPEEVSSGERRDLTASMILYAMDGQGNTPLKGVLQNKLDRIMNLGAEDEDPLHAKIGDMQCHHFVVNIPENAKNIDVRIDSSIGKNMSLSMKHDSFAYPTVADYISTDIEAQPRLQFGELEPGLWYITVQSLSQVSVTETDYGQAYSSSDDVLNGIPYKITVSWE